MWAMYAACRCACAEKFNCYSYSVSVSMYTACRCGLRVQAAIYVYLRSGIEFCRRPQATQDINSVNI